MSNFALFRAICHVSTLDNTPLASMELRGDSAIYLHRILSA